MMKGRKKGKLERNSVRRDKKSKMKKKKRREGKGTDENEIGGM